MSTHRTPGPNAEQTAALMRDFLRRTSDTPTPASRRYLWTDAFAVCNLFGLAKSTGDKAYTARALQLIDDVHHALGQHRDDETRHGWLSGLDGAEAEDHPTAGGLRIGKPLPERARDAPFDERAEWERDGQYFHYLSKWMHALDQAARATGEPRYSRWSRELAQRAYEAFVYRPAPGSPARMFWKVSIDLSWPLVPAMGQHDPLDGFVTFLQLQVTARELGCLAEGPDLEPAIAVFAEMARDGNWTTADALGIGGLLGDAYRLAQLQQRGTQLPAPLLSSILDSAEWGLVQYQRGNEIQFPAEYRLAFRELGLAIGLHAAKRQLDTAAGDELRERLQRIDAYRAMGEAVVSFWNNPVHQNVSTWQSHRDINEVMLATALSPDGFLELN